MTRRRLDTELVRRGLASSRTEAKVLVDSGAVLVSGSPASKCARLVDAGEPVVVVAPARRFVGRGGDKLDYALDRFELDVAGLTVLDAGASTGGFTDALLSRGAARVVAVDVGRHQLHERLRGDPRVDSFEQTDIRDLDVASVGGPFQLVVADLSFISLGRVADALAAAVADVGTLVVLVKPQFEAGKADVSRGKGVITDPEIWVSATHRAVDSLARRGLVADMLCPSPVRGHGGNVEFLARCDRGPADADSLSMLVRDAVAEATGGL